MGAIIFKGNLMVSGQFSGGKFSSGAFSRGATFLAGNFSREELSGRQLSGGGGNHPKGNCPGDTLIYIEKCGTVKNKECKKRYHKKSQLRKFFKYV